MPITIFELKLLLPTKINLRRHIQAGKCAYLVGKEEGDFSIVLRVFDDGLDYL